ncbi:ABC transporter permease [Lederbergia lenta]|uniref:ABC transporter permease n=1 Tax=Lederbergia lenta TaxID=1467 RepID=A0A2X4W7G4_LEDLE|nr:ABC transporter permease [Lederbergia lenta]MEC2325900.1 ABC transporter permease [Lederbergia lenta]SQI53570.1 ABC transporter permease [Lederbergia lenta]
MMNLAMANIRKSKSATISLFIFILVAALLLNIGLMVITQLSTFFDQKADQLNDPHVTIIMDQASYHPTYGEFLANYSGVKETETEEIINISINFNFGNGELTNSVVIFNADANRNIGPLKLIEKLNTSTTNDIFVPYSFKTNGGYDLGDDFIIHYQNKDYEYRIAGFLETTMMGTNNIGVMKFMLPESSYQTLAAELDNQSKGLIMSAVMEDKTQSTKLENDFIQNAKQSQVEETTLNIWGLNFELVKNVNTLTINIVATILVAFAAIIVLVSLIVIKFRVSNNIEDGMANIGVLKSIGYTSRQILSSIILQYILIALCGSVVGIALSYALMPLIGGIISTLSGLIWIQSFDMIVNLISIFFVTICVVLVTLLSAFRVRKILPVAALRGGIQTHSFRKNRIPLEKAKGNLHFLLAMKSMLANAKQNIMIVLIIMALTFATVFSVVLYYNIASDKTAFVNLFGSEPANVYIAVKLEADTRDLLSNIEQMDHVRKVNIFDLITTNIDGQIVYTNVTDHYNQLENNIVYEGRQPKYENEISISWVVSSQIDKGIGDTVEVEYGNETVSYLVTGLSQSIGNLGQIASLTMEGMQQLQSGYKGATLYVYLEGISTKDFIKNVKEQYGDDIVETLDIDENIESQTSMYTAAVFAVMVMVLIITILVVVMILYLVIKTMITKRKQEFGVMKAIGYSTIQLMNQISISFLPVIITGVIIGGVLGYFFTNPMLSVLLSNAGIKRLEFIIHLPTIIMICVGILILAYIVSMFVSRKIKKISAYGLITE